MRAAGGEGGGTVARSGAGGVVLVATGLVAGSVTAWDADSRGLWPRPTSTVANITRPTRPTAAAPSLAPRERSRAIRSVIAGPVPASSMPAGSTHEGSDVLAAGTGGGVSISTEMSTSVPAAGAGVGPGAGATREDAAGTGGAGTAGAGRIAVLPS